jgi:hypothetical protein
MAEKAKKNVHRNKTKRKPVVPAPQGVTLGDLLGKKLESVKRDSEEKQKIMVKEARNNPAVQRSSEKFFINEKDFRVFVELPKFNKQGSECRTFRDKIIFLFKSLHTIEERPQSFKDRLFDRIFDMLEISKLKREDFNMYRKSMRNINEEQLAIDCAVEETTEIVSAQWYKKGKVDGFMTAAK